MYSKTQPRETSVHRARIACVAAAHISATASERVATATNHYH